VEHRLQVKDLQAEQDMNNLLTVQAVEVVVQVQQVEMLHFKQVVMVVLALQTLSLAHL
jgi:ribosomal protein L4